MKNILLLFFCLIAPALGQSPRAILNRNCGSIIEDVGGTNKFAKELIVTSNSLTRPTDMEFLPNDPNAYLVIGQTGKIYYFKDWNCSYEAVVDVASILPVGGGAGERGLLDLAIHPNFATNGFIYLYHTSVDASQNSVSRLTVSLNPFSVGDCVRIIDMKKGGSAANHNGGGLVFAPDDTLLISVGEGGSGGNPQNNTNLMGKVLRIDPSTSVGNGGYGIPLGNMFPAANPICTGVTNSGSPCPEILAMGLRNPFTISMENDDVFLGDVGATYEEINTFNYLDNTVSFGWPHEQGYGGNETEPLLSVSRSDSTAAQYRAEDPMGVMAQCFSIIIGDVYSAQPLDRYRGRLTGALLFADWYDGWFRYMGPNGTGHIVHQEGITSIIEGPNGYIYFISRKDYNTGCAQGGTSNIYRLVLLR